LDLGDFGRQRLELLQQHIRIAHAIHYGVRVLDVEVVAAFGDVLGGDLPGVFAFLALVPPLLLGLKLLDPHGPGLGVALLPVGVRVLVVPNVLGGPALLKEEQVRLDAGVRGKHAVGQPHDGVQVELSEELLLDAGLDAFAKECAVGEDHSRSTIGLEQLHDQHQEEVRRFPRPEGRRKIVLDTVLFHTPEGWIGDDHVHVVLLAVVGEGTIQRVVVFDLIGHLDTVEDHVGDRQHVRELLLLHPKDAALDLLPLSGRFGLGLQVLDSAG